METGARVQPAEIGPKKNRFRGVYLLIPQHRYQNWAEIHRQLAQVEYAPPQFENFLVMLIERGGQVYVPHAVAEFNAYQAELTAQAVAHAQEVLAEDPNKTPRKYTDQERTEAMDFLTKIQEEALAEQAAQTPATPALEQHAQPKPAQALEQAPLQTGEGLGTVPADVSPEPTPVEPQA